MYNDMLNQPLISILMAVYDPKITWFREQLSSLNSQTYPNLRLYIRDDCSPKVPFDEIKTITFECITKFPVFIDRNEVNLGSNRTFEILTKVADGDFFAYCDQDDVWLPEKLSALYNSIYHSNALLVCSDMYIIDENSKVIADSITQIRRHHTFYSGTNLLPKIIVSNYVYGCAMLIKSSIAKECIPFCPYMFHDHYLALYCSTKGLITSIPKSLIYYRIHRNNQTLVMAGVTNKESYYKTQIKISIERLYWLLNNFDCNDDVSNYISKVLIWEKARESWYYKRPGAFVRLWKLRRVKPLVTLFELFSFLLPDFIFKFLIYLHKRNFF